MKWWAVLALLLTGCAGVSRPGRIARHEDLFSTYPPNVQGQIRAGWIEPGFTKAMVRMAWGLPDRHNQAGLVDIWAWTAQRREDGPGWALGTGGLNSGFISIYAPPEMYDRVRVFFENGVVTSIEWHTPRCEDVAGGCL